MVVYQHSLKGPENVKGIIHIDKIASHALLSRDYLENFQEF